MPAPAWTYAAPTVAHADGADGDAGIEVAGEVGGEDGAGVDAAGRRLELVDDLPGAHLRRARHGPGGEAGTEDVQGAQPLPQPPFHLAHQVHHVGVPFDDHQVGYRDRAILHDASDVVSSQVHEHPMLGQLLLVGTHVLGQGALLLRGLASGPCPGDRPHRDRALLQPHEDLG